MSRLFTMPALRLSLPLLLCLLVGCTSSPDKRILQLLTQQGFGKRYEGNSLQDVYLTVGDKVIFRGTKNLEINGNGQIAMDGTIDFDKSGRVWLAGLTLEEAEVHLTEKALANYNSADVKVTLVAAPPQYFIFGEISGKVGSRPLVGDLTLFEAVIAANPLENSANLGRVRLIRPSPVDPLVFRANIGQLLQTGDSTFNTLIQDNDIIIVPPTMLAQVGYFISDLVFPFTTVFSTVLKGLVGLNNLGNKGGNKNKNSGIF